ncbi:heme o synthase [Acidicapsa ligni]|uniref:heme o synthase n=1 Tax=Acidicapsa ligni TaxID=542300 RepID=UPI0037C02437
MGRSTKRHRSPVSTAAAAYWALTKPDVNMLVAVIVGIAFCLATTRASRHLQTLVLLNLVLGTLLMAGGSSALNQYIERRSDARMRRISRLPLAAGKLEPIAALCFGLLLSVAGALYLAVAVNALASLLAALASATYLFVYTPLKRITPLCTLAGAFPGAVPPLIGWAAASGSLSLEAWVLYSFLFIWQFPHFMAIAWMHRQDYVRARYRVLPGRSKRITFLKWQTLLPLLIAIPMTSVPTLLGYAGWVYASGSLLLSCLFLCCGVKLVVMRTSCAARRLLFASTIYLPSIFLLLVLDRT